MFLEWFPQIVYNHHQTGPAGAVIFMPPFRDPFNYHFDPLIPLGVEAVGTAMHQRLVAEGKGGVRAAFRRELFDLVERRAAHHRLFPQHDRAAHGDRRQSHADPDTAGGGQAVANRRSGRCRLRRGTWHYRQSIEYEMSNNRAVLDYASRYRETLLYDFYRMGRNSIENGSRGSLDDHARSHRSAARRSAGERSTELPPDLRAGGLGGATLPADSYKSVLRDPGHRDPRGYIIPSDQPDFPPPPSS